MLIKRYNQFFINENKMWYKTIPQILDWLESKSKMPWIFLDTETTGLGGPDKQQLTQVSAILSSYNFSSNKFITIDSFDKKIKLTKEIKSRYSNQGDDSRKILSFNHYGSGNYKYENEKDVLDEFFKWIGESSPCLMVAQNAGFDMAMISGRFNNKIKNEVFDTKMLIQLYYLPLIQKLSESNDKYKNILRNIGVSERDNGLVSSSMSKIGPSLGINMEGYHDALTDCKITMEMYQKILNLLKEHNQEDISKYQIERIKTIRE